MFLVARAWQCSAAGASAEIGAQSEGQGVKLVWPSSDCWLVIEEWEDERLFRAEIAVGRRFGQLPVEPSGGVEERLGAECADGGCETRVD